MGISYAKVVSRSEVKGMRKGKMIGKKKAVRVQPQWNVKKALKSANHELLAGDLCYTLVQNTMGYVTTGDERFE